MQQIYCPECGTKAQAENINVQALIAVCGDCDTVFKFSLPGNQDKAKRRKVKQPIGLEQITDSNDLHMAFRTNWRLDADETVAVSAAFIGIGSFLTFLFGMEAIAGDVSIPLLMMGLIMVLVSGYGMAMRVYNKTHIEMDHNQLTVSRQPLPVIRQEHTVSLADVRAIHCVETEASIEHKYDTPRFRVYAETGDGRERLIISDVVEDYGFYIAQQLQRQLAYDQDIDMTRLADTDNYADEYVIEADRKPYSQGQK